MEFEATLNAPPLPSVVDQEPRGHSMQGSQRHRGSLTSDPGSNSTHTTGAQLDEHGELIIGCGGGAGAGGGDNVGHGSELGIIGSQSIMNNGQFYVGD